MSASLAVILLRFIQYGAAAILFGSPLFLLRNPLIQGDEAALLSRWLLAGVAVMLVVAAPLGFLFQLTGLAGSFAAAMDPAALHAGLWEMSFGASSMARFALALLALAACCGSLRLRRVWWICAILGALICVSFAWMGHGAASQGAFGWTHLIADLFHCLAAAGWIGALVVFCVALWRPRKADASSLHASLAAFSGMGALLVAAILLSGLINSAFLTGWDVRKVIATAYGQVLAAKLVLFAVMLILAAMNRFRHTHDLGEAIRDGTADASVLTRLRRSVGVETAAAFAILAVVALLGTLPPVLEL